MPRIVLGVHSFAGLFGLVPRNDPVKADAWVTNEDDSKGVLFLARRRCYQADRMILYSNFRPAPFVLP
jgi:hypothetical protein